MAGPVTRADGVVVIRNADGLGVCRGCGAPVIKGRGSQFRIIHHWDPCPEAERVLAEKRDA